MIIQGNLLNKRADVIYGLGYITTHVLLAETVKYLEVDTLANANTRTQDAWVSALGHSVNPGDVTTDLYEVFEFPGGGPSPLGNDACLRVFQSDLYLDPLTGPEISALRSESAMLADGWVFEEAAP